MRGLRGAAETAASAQQLIRRVEAAKAVVRGEGFYEAERYLPATRTLEAALRIVSAAHHPTELSLHNFTMRQSIERSAEVLEATLDEDENPYLAWFRTEILPRLLARRPRVVGLSVIYGSQLIPALTLGRLIKEELPDCHVTSGGGFLAYIGQKLMRAPGIEACLDSLVEHEGERPRGEDHHIRNEVVTEIDGHDRSENREQERVASRRLPVISQGEARCDRGSRA